MSENTPEAADLDPHSNSDPQPNPHPNRGAALDEPFTSATKARALAAKILGRARRRQAAPKSPPAPDPTLLRAGDLVAGRYRIVHLIERGGVGQVYRAEDLELGGVVALKTLRPKFAASREAIERFRKEIFLARQVTHDNVCRLFDLGRQPSTEPGGEDLFFVTMELLEGETLGERIRRQGRLSLQQSLEIARQVALGLLAAHRKGVIHRDIKGGNVLLVRQPDGSIRAVVTDFGLALETLDNDPQGTAPSPSRLEGTPLFMAPEQVTGGAVSSATDIYSLGILLYHMVTGGWPFLGATAVSTALARMDQEPIPPSHHVPDLDPGVEAIILRCLERRSEDRFASVADLLAAIDRIAPHSESRPPLPGRPNKRWVFAVLLGISIGTALTIGWLLRSSSPPAEVLPTTRTLRPALVVAGFETSGEQPDIDGLSIALGQGIAAALSQGQDLRVVDLQAQEELRAELPLGPGSDQSLDLWRLAGVPWTLRGRYRLGSPETDRALELTLHLEHHQGEPGSQTLDLSGSVDHLPELFDRAGFEIRRALQLALPSEAQRQTARAEVPEQPQAALHYARGVLALRRFDATTARQELKAALEIEAEHPLILSSLAETMAQLGYQQRSEAIAEQAFHHAGGLSREQQLTIEARYRLASHEWRRAEELFRALHEFFFDNLDYGLSLASAQDRSARFDEALQTLESLRDLPEPLGSDPRIDLTEALIAYHSGDYSRSQRAAEEAAEKARQLDMRLLLARALDREALTRVSVDDNPDRAKILLEEALSLYSAVDHKLGLTEALFTLGQLDRNRGELDRSENLYQQGLEIATTTGNLAAQARGMTALGILCDLRGQLSKGLAFKEAVLDNYRRRDVRQGEAITLENLGISRLKAGHPQEALDHFLQAAETFGELGDTIGVSWAPYHEGKALADLGELELARQSFERARRAAVEHPEGGLATATEFELLRLAVVNGHPAETTSDIAERIRALIAEHETLDQPLEAHQTRLLQAWLLARQGHFPAARQLATEAVSFFDRADLPPHAAEAKTVEALLTLSTYQGGLDNWPEVRASCADLEHRLVGLEFRKIALQGQVVLARCSRAADDPTDRVGARLRDIMQEAESLALAAPLLEARCLHTEVLARGTSEARGGLPPEPNRAEPCAPFTWAGQPEMRRTSGSER